MKTSNRFYLSNISKTVALQKFNLLLAFGLALALVTSSGLNAATTGRVYATPEEAVADLKVATSSADSNAVKAIFGPAAIDLQNPDRVEAANDFAAFSKALTATNHLVRISDTNLVLEIGNDLWPFPIPLIKQQGKWHFDTEAGREEIINRRIGQNELEILSVMRAYVDAQREYASLDRDGDQVLEYAQRLNSSPGQTDGLYWPIDLNGQMSPLGPMVADAQEEGYFSRKPEPGAGPTPFHGYYFKVLTRQGKHAPGGKYDYVINGNMIGGFALVAWPAEYGNSGIMTFIVSQQGRVYQKNLGSKTHALTKAMKEYNPDETWTVSPD